MAHLEEVTFQLMEVQTKYVLMEHTSLVCMEKSANSV